MTTILARRANQSVNRNVPLQIPSHQGTKQHNDKKDAKIANEGTVQDKRMFVICT